MNRIYDWLARTNAVIGVLALMTGLLAMPQEAAAAAPLCVGTCPTLIGGGGTVCVVQDNCVASTTATKCGCLVSFTYNPNGTIITCTAVCITIAPTS
jgi:hypothetical protein